MDDDDNDDDLFLKISVRIEPLLLGCSDLSLFKIVIILTSGCYFLFKFSPFSIIHLCYGLICDLYIRGSSFPFKIIVAVAVAVAPSTASNISHLIVIHQQSACIVYMPYQLYLLHEILIH